jgi:hypothetical protein
LNVYRETCVELAALVASAAERIVSEAERGDQR